MWGKAVKLLLKLGQKAGEVEAVTDGVVDLDRQRKEAAVSFLKKSADCENGEQVVAAPG